MPACIRQAGSAGCCVTQDSQGYVTSLGGFQAVPGLQTVPRAETLAATTAVAHGASQVSVDAAYVAKGFHGGPLARDKLARSSNGELWDALFDQAGDVKFNKVTAHTSYLNVCVR